LKTEVLRELCPAELSFCCGASSFLQSDFWGSFKSRFGWKTYSFAVTWDDAGTSTEADRSAKTSGDAGNKTFPLLVLYRRLGLGIGFAYVPWGPDLPKNYDMAEHRNAAVELAAALRSLLPKETAIIRFDFPWFIENTELLLTENKTNSSSIMDMENFRETSRDTFRHFFTRAAADVQPPDSVLVDLAPDEKTILGAMKSKWRYNIGLAEKKGVAVRFAAIGDIATAPDAGDLASFYRIYRETAERDGISIHGMGYYTALFEEAAKYNIDMRLYMASHEGEDISGIVTLFRGQEAVYLYGASSNQKRNLMSPYALQWKAMRDAKAAGCAFYDLFGIPPKPSEDDPNHPMAGLYRFKTGFIGDKGEGGRIIHRPGSWDYTCRPLAKALYSTAEKTRKKIWDIKKRLKRR